MAGDAENDEQQADLRSLLGEEYESAKLLDATEVAELLSVADRSVYELGIPRVQVSRGRVRWSLRDLRRFIDDRRQAA